MSRCKIELDEYVPVIQIFAKLKEHEQVAFLDSSLIGERGRYSILGLKPYHSIIKNKGKLLINGQESPLEFELYFSDYLQKNVEYEESTLPMIDGAIGFFSYDYGREQMKLSTKHEEEDWEVPEAIWIFYDLLIIEDGMEKKTFVISQGKTGDSREIIQAFIQNWKSKEIAKEHPCETVKVKVQANFTKEQYQDAVQELIQSIEEGDVYITNMTQMLKVESGIRPKDFFLTLREKNPSSFGGYFNYGEFQIVSASPERFICCKDKKIQTRLIKGTRKRSKNQIEDELLRQELEQSEKEKSELLMIVDLERNDLNQVCIPGTVNVNRMNEIVSYATVHHLESEITGVLQGELGFMEVIKACFPGGSITGAPKQSSMKIIDKLEHGKRGIYTGSIGYLSQNGDFDLNIVIRTALHRNGEYWIGAGGGITCESDAEFEYEETLQKAQALLEALGGKNIEL